MNIQKTKNNLAPLEVGRASRPRVLMGGFTLIEILVIVGLFGLLAAMGAFIGFDSIGRSSVHSERDLVVLMLTGARTRALANVNQVAHGVHITADKIIIFEGLSYSGTTEPATDRNDAIDMTPEPATIVFKQLSAEATDGNNICNPLCTITFKQGPQVDTIEINGQGRIDW